MLRAFRICILMGILLFSYTAPAVAASSFAYNLQTKFTLQKIEVQDKYRNPPAEVKNVISRHEGEQIGLLELRQVMKDIRSLYERSGLGYVKVRLPLERSREGVVVILVSAPGEPDPFSLNPPKSSLHSVAKPFEEESQILSDSFELDKGSVDESLEEDEWLDVDFDEASVASEDDVVLDIPDEFMSYEKRKVTHEDLSVLQVMQEGRGEKTSSDDAQGSETSVHPAAKNLVKALDKALEVKSPSVSQEKDSSIESVSLEGVTQVNVEKVEKKLSGLIVGRKFEMPLSLLAAKQIVVDMYVSQNLPVPDIQLSIEELAEKRLKLMVSEVKAKVNKQSQTQPVVAEKVIAASQSKPKPKALTAQQKAQVIRARPPYKMSERHKKFDEGVYILKDPQKVRPKKDLKEEAEEQKEVKFPARMKALPAPPIVENYIEYMEEPTLPAKRRLEDGSL